jgi:hypothetical protein
MALLTWGRACSSLPELQGSQGLPEPAGGDGGQKGHLILSVGVPKMSMDPGPQRRLRGAVGQNEFTPDFDFGGQAQDGQTHQPLLGPHEDP